MPRFVAFLRAINVGGRNVTMAALRAQFEALGFSNVETFIASGNVIFEAASRDSAALHRKIEAHLAKSLGHEVSTFVRTDATSTSRSGRRCPKANSALLWQDSPKMPRMRTKSVDLERSLQVCPRQVRC
jgi:Protein of unknown function (DUF1697)